MTNDKDMYLFIVVKSVKAAMNQLLFPHQRNFRGRPQVDSLYLYLKIFQNKVSFELKNTKYRRPAGFSLVGRIGKTPPPHQLKIFSLQPLSHRPQIVDFEQI